MRQIGQDMIGNLSFFLGGKSASDGTKWRPNLEAPQVDRPCSSC
ncbi:hypothetical protein FOC1_g10000043 [Fusarium oxysporum f. sp. cubense race 1]|uniref:Uncharacterized protein n=2 Tax=Fusarium oxysporum species complex TaxID=171631 RepID=N4TJC4_FUSC1|nr:hypothetical protein FOC1_g10000043 [Fusarium oxysporum f. sp. cubense race 1]